MGNIVKTAKCRFCGQMTQIEADEETDSSTGRGTGNNDM